MTDYSMRQQLAFLQKLKRRESTWHAMQGKGFMPSNRQFSVGPRSRGGRGRVHRGR